MLLVEDLLLQDLSLPPSLFSHFSLAQSSPRPDTLRFPCRPAQTLNPRPFQPMLGEALPAGPGLLTPPPTPCSKVPSSSHCSKVRAGVTSVRLVEAGAALETFPGACEHACCVCVWGGCGGHKRQK